MARTQADNKHAERQAGEEKRHGDVLDAAVSSAGEHDSDSPGARQSAIPAPEDGGHALSPAAHLGGHVHGHTKPTGDQRGIIKAEEFPRQPPRQVARVGKQHRGQ